jgi:hypothetical protein
VYVAVVAVTIGIVWNTLSVVLSEPDCAIAPDVGRLRIVVICQSSQRTACIRHVVDIVVIGDIGDTVAIFDTHLVHLLCLGETKRCDTDHAICFEFYERHACTWRLFFYCD